MSHLEAHVKAAVLEMSAEFHVLSAARRLGKVTDDDYAQRVSEAVDRATAKLVGIMRLERVKLLRPLDN